MDAPFLMAQDAALKALRKKGWWRCIILGEGSFGCAIKGLPGHKDSLSMSMMLCSKGMLDSRLFCISLDIVLITIYARLSMTAVLRKVGTVCICSAGPGPTLHQIAVAFAAV